MLHAHVRLCKLFPQMWSLGSEFRCLFKACCRHLEAGVRVAGRGNGSQDARWSETELIPVTFGAARGNG